MKKLILFIYIFIPVLVFSQGFPIPVPLTDSFTDNRNPEIKRLDIPQTPGGAIMIWEKSTDTLSTALYMKHLYSQGFPPSAEVQVLSQTGIHYRHPVLAHLVPGGDTLFYLFYETDQNGNKDIYFLKYSTDGTFNGPFPFSTGAGDDISLQVADGSGWPITFGVVWQSAGQILTSHLDYDVNLLTYTISMPQIIDTGAVSNPAISADGLMLFWLRQVGDSSKIAYSFRSDTNYQWSTPQQINYPGNFSHLTILQGDNLMQGCHILICHNTQADGQRVMSYDADEQAWYSSAPSAYEITNPGGLFTPIFVKGHADASSICSFFQSFLYGTDSTGNEEVILIPQLMLNPWAVNLSNFSGIDRNPKGFVIWGMDMMYIGEYLWLWESYRNGHWQLYYTYADISGGIDQPKDAEAGILCYPNPFSGGTTIEWNSRDKGIVEAVVYSISGEKVSTLKPGGSAGEHLLFYWDGKSAEGKEMPAGMYILNVRSESGLILNKKLFKI